MVSRERDAQDARRSQLRLTEQGINLITELSPRIASVTGRLFEPLTETEQHVVIELLTKVATVEDPTFPRYSEAILALLAGDSSK